MSHDTLMDHNQDLRAVVTYLVDKVFPDEGEEAKAAKEQADGPLQSAGHQREPLAAEDVRRRLDRTINMIERLGQEGSRDMLAKEIKSDVSALVTWFEEAAAYTEGYVHAFQKMHQTWSKMHTYVMHTYVLHSMTGKQTLLGLYVHKSIGGVTCNAARYNNILQGAAGKPH